MKKTLLAAAVAAFLMTPAVVSAQPPLPAPVVTDVDGPMGLGSAVLNNAINVAFNGYTIVGINVIERRTDDVIVVQVTTHEGARLIGLRSSESNISDNPCWDQRKLMFHRAIMAGGKLVTCIYDPGMYVSDEIYSSPKTTVTPTDVEVVDIDTRTTTHAGNNILKNYTITEVQSYEYR